MRIRTEKRMVEQLIETYIAIDGKEFDTEAKCRKYEEDLDRQIVRAEAEKLEIKDLEGVYPLDTDAQYINDNHCFKWYRVNNAEELETVSKAYSNDFFTPRAYPEIICVEFEDYDYSWGRDAWQHILSDMKEATVEFWKKHGLSVEFKEMK